MADPILGEQQFVPNQLVSSNRTRFYRDPVSGAMSVQYTKDGGTTWKQFISEPSSVATEGWVPSLTASGEVVWKPLLSVAADSSAAPARAQLWTDLIFPGTIYTNHEFGYFKVPDGQNMECYGSQISVFTPASGSAITVRLVRVRDGASTITGSEMQLAAGQPAGVNLINPVQMRATSEWRLILTSVGSVDPGEFLSCRLLLNVLQ